MNKIIAKKMEILNGIYKTKDSLSWNETSEMLNDLINRCMGENEDGVVHKTIDANTNDVPIGGVHPAILFIRGGD